MPSRILILFAVFLAANAIGVAGSHSPKNARRSNSSQKGSSSSGSALQDCVSVSETQKHIGRTRCVTGTVVRVEEGSGGVTFLDFCPDYHTCPFTVVVFRSDLASIGDVRQLQGRAITIKGTIEEYDDRAEIVLRHPQQLGDNAALLPAIPKDYDVERQGHFSAGTFRAKKPKRTRSKRQGPPISITDAEEP